MHGAEAAFVGGDIDFTERDFERLCALIYAQAGIALSQSKRQMAYSRVGRRLRALGLDSFRVYLDRLEAHRDSPEWQEFTNALTTNLTAFFREQHHFPVLAELLQRAGSRGKITLWCSAASTGEEPYSMAMTAIDVLGSRASMVRILATDVDTNVLRTAGEAIYSMDRIEKLPADRTRRYFLKGSGARAGFARVRDEVRDLIVFRPLNLLHENWPIREPLDAIFCRNVMIYFNKETQTKILDRFAPLLRRDGLLFAGHSENFFYNCRETFRIRGKTVYELAL